MVYGQRTVRKSARLRESVYTATHDKARAVGPFRAYSHGCGLECNGESGVMPACVTVGANYMNLAAIGKSLI